MLEIRINWLLTVSRVGVLTYMACLLNGMAFAQDVPVAAAVQAESVAGAASEIPVGAMAADEQLVDVALPVPGALQLEAMGARIGDIEFQVDDVFDANNPKESGVAYRTANFLHINTQASTLRPQLLFKTGDVYSLQVMVETARNLRARRYVDEASVTPLRYHPETNTVDVLVRTHDVWTLNPGVSAGRSGGESSSGFQLEESNLLGLGKAVQAEHSKNVDRSLWKFSYEDPNVLSTRWEMDIDYYLASDGGTKGISIDHPFYSLDTRWSASAQAAHETRTERRFEQGEVVDQWHTMQNTFDVQGGWSTGRVESGWRSPWVLRGTLGYSVDNLYYSPDAELGTTDLPSNQRLRYPWFGVSWFEDRYVVTRNRDRIERTEDLFLGRSVSLTAGYASPSLGADRTAWVIDLQLLDAYQPGEGHEMVVHAGVTGRREADEWRGAIFDSGLRYDWRQSSHYRFVMKFDYAHSENLDDAQQLYLGSDEGLRGYPLRYRSGTQRGVLTLEQRYYSRVQILRLLSVGAAAFVDTGLISGQKEATASTQKIFSDVGLGLRLGNIRSSRGDVFHLDLAYPVNAPREDRKVQFSVITEHSF